MKEHIQARLNAPHHRRANWYVGTIQDEVAVSLGAYPMQFLLNGKTIPGFAIGSVYTKESHRKKGYAPALISFVEDFEQKQFGHLISSLYSDINPDYYANMGYQLCPSHESETELKPELVSSEKPELELVEFDKEQHKNEMKSIYDNYHSQKPLSIKRSDDYWEMILEKFPQDRYFFLKNSFQETMGYLRLQISEDSVRITDYALSNREDSLYKKSCDSLIHQAIQWNCKSLTGWFPDFPPTSEILNLQDRSTEITMVKSLEENLAFDLPAIESVDFFCEIDHV